MAPCLLDFLDVLRALDLLRPFELGLQGRVSFLRDRYLHAHSSLCLCSDPVILLQGLDSQLALPTRFDRHQSRAGAGHRGLIGHVLNQRSPADGRGIHLGDLVPHRIDDQLDLAVLDVVHAMRPALFDLVHRVHHDAASGQVGGRAPRVRDARGFTSSTWTVPSLTANCTFIRPITWSSCDRVIVCRRISSTIAGEREYGGSEQAASPEWTPASSMCSMMPPMTTRCPSERASTSISYAVSCLKKKRTGSCNEALMCWARQSLTLFARSIISLARASTAQDDRNTTGR